MTNQERIEKLAAAIPNLPPKDQEFARSLFQNFMIKKTLSDKQWYWVDKMTERANVKVTELFDGTKIRELFDTAKENLKNPSVKIKLSKDSTLRFYLAGPKSRNPGYIVVDNGKSYDSGERKIYALVDLEGNMAIADITVLEVKDYIIEFAKDPVGRAKVNGIAYSYCCFCSTELTSPISLFHGYGPICAEHYGLPWEGDRNCENEITKETEL